MKAWHLFCAILPLATCCTSRRESVATLRWQEQATLSDSTSLRVESHALVTLLDSLSLSLDSPLIVLSDPRGYRVTLSSHRATLKRHVQLHAQNDTTVILRSGTSIDHRANLDHRTCSRSNTSTWRVPPVVVSLSLLLLCVATWWIAVNRRR